MRTEIFSDHLQAQMLRRNAKHLFVASPIFIAFLVTYIYITKNVLPFIAYAPIAFFVLFMPILGLMNLHNAKYGQKTKHRTLIFEDDYLNFGKYYAEGEGAATDHENELHISYKDIISISMTGSYTAKREKIVENAYVGKRPFLSPFSQPFLNYIYITIQDRRGKEYTQTYGRQPLMATFYDEALKRGLPITQNRILSR